MNPRPATRDSHSPRPALRLTEILAALSLVSDLARAHPPEEAMRACLLGTALARRMGLPEASVADVYYTSLLRFVGCTATGHEYSATFGDDMAVRARGDMIDAGNPREALGFLASLGARGSRADRIRFLARLPRAAATTAEGGRADCEAGALMVRRFGLPSGVEQGLRHMFERWDGKRSPFGLQGDSIVLPARIATAAYVAVMFDAAGGVETATSIIRRWSGRTVDPAIADAFLATPSELLDVTRPHDACAAVVAAEPGTVRLIAAERLDEILRAFADAVDLKSPVLHGHSAGVSALADEAARSLGLPPDEVDAVRRAGLVHDLGRVGVSTAIWEKPARLTVLRRTHPCALDAVNVRLRRFRPRAATRMRPGRRGFVLLRRTGARLLSVWVSLDLDRVGVGRRSRPAQPHPQSSR